jgi:hypothetical protein
MCEVCDDTLKNPEPLENPLSVRSIVDEIYIVLDRPARKRKCVRKIIEKFPEECE